MELCYNKLWKLLIDKGIKKGELKELAHISSCSIAKLGKNQNVNTDIIVKICNGLQCDITDILELVNKNEGGENE